MLRETGSRAARAAVVHCRGCLVGLLAAAALLAGSPLSAEGPGGQRTISVSGEGRVRVRPDVAQTNLGVRASARTVKEAMAQARAAMQELMAALRQIGIAGQDLATSHFTIYLEQPQGEERGAPGLYHVDNMLQVRIRDLDKVDAVLESATAAGANQVWGLEFVIDDPEQALSQARRLAVAQARAKAGELALLHDSRLGKVLSIAEEGSGRPELLRAAAMEARGGGTTTPGELSVTARLQIVYQIQ